MNLNNKKIPTTDSISELTAFWDTHDLTDFEDELEEQARLFDEITCNIRRIHQALEAQTRKVIIATVIIVLLDVLIGRFY